MKLMQAKSIIPGKLPTLQSVAILCLTLAGGFNAAGQTTSSAPSDARHLLDAQIKVTKDRVSMIQANLARRTQASTFSNADYIAKVKRMMPALDTALLNYESQVESDILRPAFTVISTYRSVEQATQYTPEQKQALLAKVEAQFAEKVENVLTPRYQEIYQELILNFKKASELYTVSPYNMYHYFQFGCASSSCITLTKSDLLLIKKQIDQLYLTIDFKLNPLGGKNFAEQFRANTNYLRFDELVNNMDNESVNQSSLPFDINAADLNPIEVASQAKFKELNDRYETMFAKLKTDLLTQIQSASLHLRVPGKHDVGARNAEIEANRAWRYTAHQKVVTAVIDGCQTAIDPLISEFAELTKVTPNNWANISADLLESTGVEGGLIPIGASYIQKNFAGDPSYLNCFTKLSPYVIEWLN